LLNHLCDYIIGCLKRQKRLNCFVASIVWNKHTSCVGFLCPLSEQVTTNGRLHATVNGHKYSSPSILRYIFHIKSHFSQKNSEVISKRILIIFAPEEAIIFKDYLFILAWFYVRLPLSFYDLKTFFCFLMSNLLYILTKIKSEKSTFVLKSPENKNHADKNYHQTNK
jgi:hypothetical protein